MAISVLITTSNAGNPTTGFTIALSATVLTDDILILSISNAGAAADPAVTDNDSGGNAWALVSSQNNGSENGTVWWKRATSGTVSKTITVSGCTDSCCGTCTVYRGCTTTGNPFENVTAEANASGNETMAGFTPTMNGCQVCMSIMVGSNLPIGSEACTDPGTLTERGELGSTGGGDSRVCHASALQTTAAATGNFTWTMTDATSVSFAFDLMPPGAATGQPAVKRMGGVQHAFGGYQPGSAMMGW